MRIHFPVPPARRRAVPRTLLLVLCAAAALRAQEPESSAEPQQEPAAEQPSWSDFFQSLDPQTGQVTVQGGKATVDLPEGWRYLHQRSARQVVEQVWGNPPDPSTLGLITPPGYESDDESAPTWAIIVSHDGEGHVPDDDAASIDYGELLAAMQEDARASNQERQQAGYETVEIVGWAEQPHYDSTAKKLYWARHLRFNDADDTLNYDIRILGRRGTLVLRAVAGIDELGRVSQSSKQLLPHVQFVQGERYADYKEGIDPVVAGGIGALIAGKLLLKGGILKALAALWKPIAIGLAALGAGLFKIFGRKKAAESTTAS